jgi:hypothetical protein
LTLKPFQTLGISFSLYWGGWWCFHTLKKGFHVRPLLTSQQRLLGWKTSGDGWRGRWWFSSWAPSGRWWWRGFWFWLWLWERFSKPERRGRWRLWCHLLFIYCQTSHLCFFWGLSHGPESGIFTPCLFSRWFRIWD